MVQKNNLLVEHDFLAHILQTMLTNMPGSKFRNCITRKGLKENIFHNFIVWSFKTSRYLRCLNIFQTDPIKIDYLFQFRIKSFTDLGKMLKIVAPTLIYQISAIEDCWITKVTEVYKTLFQKSNYFCSYWKVSSLGHFNN